MGRFFTVFLLLTLFSVPVSAQEDLWSPEILPIPEETYDYMAVATWHPPKKCVDYEFGYRVEAATDLDFTQVVSSSAWLGDDAWSFILYPLPIGEIYIRVGARPYGLEEIYWSEIAVTEQKGPFISDDIFSTPKPTTTSAPPHPVVFVHGLNGQPSDWENKAENRDYVGLLTQKGFPKDLLYLYPYADYNQDGVYDFQGDIEGIAQDLPKAVEELSQKHKDLGGDGKVDIVAFSLGGLVSRSYFSSSEFSHKIRNFIDIATPHKGVYLGEVVNWLDSIPIKGSQIREAFLRFVNAVWDEIGEGRPIDFNSPAVQQVIPRNQFLTELNQLEKTPQTLDYYCLYGDVHVTLNQKFFHWTLRSKKFSMGDLIMTPESATGIPGNLCQGFGFIDEEDFEVKMVRGKVTPFLEIIAPIESLRFKHAGMIRQPEVKTRVFELLKN